jgi:hypothetical protein
MTWSITLTRSKTVRPPVPLMQRACRWALLVIAVLMLLPALALAQVPPNAVPLLPVLAAEIDRAWPDLVPRSALGAQIEQETCISLKHRFCWSTHAELKTAREYGFGLGQLTITRRFNVFEEVKAMDRTLASWQFADRYNAQYQLRALVVKDRQAWGQVQGAATAVDRLAFAMAAYNGGMGGVLSDRKVCSATRGCDPGRWFGHVERTSLKQKKAAAGYGKSFFEINREYVRNVLEVRRPRYVAALDGPR